MIQPKYNRQNNTIFLGFDSIEINRVLMFPKCQCKCYWKHESLGKTNFLHVCDVADEDGQAGSDDGEGDKIDIVKNLQSLLFKTVQTYLSFFMRVGLV